MAVVACHTIKKMDTKYWIWFSRIQKLNCMQKEKLLKMYGTPERILKLGKEKLKKIEYLSDCCIDDIYDKKYIENLEDYEEYINKNDIQLINIFDNRYPERLKNIYDKPVLIFAKGNLELLNSGGIAIVGTRNCSAYGRKTAQSLAYNLAKENVCVISGLAKGIDEYSHIGALQAKGSTIAVIGNGLDYIYPYENKYLYERILENNGLIVTEYVIGVRPSKINFPARNRIISGLSDGIVVVEAKERSGALITADFGLEQGKEIFAVPGNIDSINSLGTNDLIKQGASILTSYKDAMGQCLI